MLLSTDLEMLSLTERVAATRKVDRLADLQPAYAVGSALLLLMCCIVCKIYTQSLSHAVYMYRILNILFVV